MNTPLLTGRYSDLSRHLAQRIAASAQHLPFGVLVPSRGAAGEIVRHLLELLPEGIAGLTLYSLENFARQILNDAGEFPRQASDAERRLAMLEAVDSLNDPTPLGLNGILDRSYRDVRDAGVRLSELAGRSFRRRPRHELFLRAAKRYEQNITRLRLTDPADLLERAAVLLEGGRCGAPRQVIFGFYDVTGVQQKLLLALSSAGLVDSIYVPAVESEHDRFASRFLALAEGALGGKRQHADDGAGAGRARAVSFTTRREEVRGVCRGVRELLENGARPEEIGIVSRNVDPAEAAALERTATEFGFGVTPRVPLPLRGQRIGRAVLRLLRIREARFPRNWIIELLRDGLRLESVRGRSSIDRLDRLTRRHGIAGGGRVTVEAAIEGLRSNDAEAADELTPFSAAVAEIDALTAPFASAASAERWREIVSQILERLHPSTAEDLQAIETIEATATLARSFAAVRPEFDAASFAELLDAESLAPARPEGPRIWFGDVMSMRGRSFRHLFAMNLQEDRFPQGRAPDPILTDPDRTALDLPQIGDGREEEQLLFQLLLDSAESAHLSCALSDGFGRVLRPSPFLARFEVEKAAANPPVGPPAFLTPHLRRQVALIERSASGGEYDGYIEVDEAMRLEMTRRLESISPTVFEDFGECPQKFLFKRLLRVDELEDPDHEAQINYLQKGALDHAILERFYSQSAERLAFYSPGTAAHLPADLYASLRAIVEEEFDRFDRERPPFNETIRGMERRFTARNLERFLLGDLEELHGVRMRPVHFEYRFGTTRHGQAQHPEISIELASMRIAFRGSIDRIDRSIDEPYRYRVIDYKSGRALRHKGLAGRIDAGQRLQLAIYAIAAEEIFGVDPEQISGAIRPLGIPGAKDDYAFDLAGHREQLIEVLNTFVDAILEGRFPAYVDSESCKYCPLSLGCRTKHDRDELRALRNFENALDLLREDRP